MPTVFNTLGITELFNNRTVVNLFEANNKIRDYYSLKWSRDIQTVPKLRTYRLYKTEFGCEEYVKLNLRKYERSLLSQFRCGILPLRVETGRYIGEPVETRLCKFCNLNTVEDEKHFLLSCKLYDVIRQNVYSDIILQTAYTSVSSDDKLAFLLNIHPRKTAKYIVKAYLSRRSVMYS
jgi:hypothetical protein